MLAGTVKHLSISDTCLHTRGCFGQVKSLLRRAAMTVLGDFLLAYAVSPSSHRLVLELMAHSYCYWGNMKGCYG